MDGCSIRDAALRLQGWRSFLPSRGPLSSIEILSGESNEPLRFTLQHIDGRHPYLVDRGVAPSIGVGVYTGRGFLGGRIVIPIHNEDGELIAYIGRALGDDVPKYRFPTGFKKSRVLFNLHCALATGAREVIVVEGFFDTFGRLSRGRRTDGIHSVEPPSRSPRAAL
jgi:hypothetical protein